MKWLIALLLFCFSTYAQASPHYGVDYLALQHKRFPVKRALAVFRGVENPALGFLWRTFGKRTNGLKRFVREHGDRSHLIRVHMYNAVCVRHRNCSSHELMPKWDVDTWNKKLVQMPKALKRKLQQRALKIRQTLEAIANENTKLVLSVALEDNLQTNAAKNLVQVVREVWPYDIIRNPMSPLESIATADALELHTAHSLLGKGLYLYGSLDGASVKFPHRPASTEKYLTPNDTRAFLRSGNGRVRALFLWDGAHQGLKFGGTKAAPAPLKRNILVDRRDVKTFRNLLKETNRHELHTEQTARAYGLRRYSGSTQWQKDACRGYWLYSFCRDYSTAAPLS